LDKNQSRSNSNSILTVEDVRNEIHSDRENVGDLVMNLKSKSNESLSNTNNDIINKNTSDLENHEKEENIVSNYVILDQNSQKNESVENN